MGLHLDLDGCARGGCRRCAEHVSIRVHSRELFLRCFRDGQELLSDREKVLDVEKSESEVEALVSEQVVGELQVFLAIALYGLDEGLRICVGAFLD